MGRRAAGVPTPQRQHDAPQPPGYGKTFYQDASGRNDFIAAKVARDAENLYFYVETADPITAPTGSGWMTLLIDVDRDKNTGWEGYNYAINRRRPSETKRRWSVPAEVDLVRGRQGRVPRRGQPDGAANPERLLSLPPNNPLDLEFKWTDNVPGSGDILDFYLHGDVAPGGRFNYRYQVP